MKVISIWQPFASLVVKGYKVFETRGWAPPKSIIGERIGIASTKNITREQRLYHDDDDFQRFYSNLNMPKLIDLPHGYLLGTVIVDSFELMSPEFMDDVSNEEQAYGWWEVDRYAWRLRSPIEFIRPIAIRGQQGLYDWNGVTPDENAQKCEAIVSERPKDIRGCLRVV